MNRLRLIPFIVYAVASVACTESQTEGDPIGSDPAHVTVIRSDDDDQTYRTINPDPDLSLGVIDGSGPTAFTSVEGIHVGRDGTIWVSDRQTNELRLFDPSGGHITTIGGTGDGPGEFRAIRLLGATRSDSVAVYDRRNGRLSWYTPNGVFARDERLIGTDEAPPAVYDVTEDGHLIGQVPTILQAGTLEPGSLIADTASIVRWDSAGGAPDTVGRAPTIQWVWTGREQIAVPFTSNTGVAARDEIFLTTGAAYEIQAIDSSGTIRRLVVDRDPTEVTSTLRDEYQAFVREVYPPARQDSWIEVMEHSAVPGVAPAYARLLLSNSGDLWAQRWTPDRRDSGNWDVFDPEGRFRGVVINPPGLYLHEIRSDATYGVWIDELGVSHVRRHSLSQGAGGASP